MTFDVANPSLLTHVSLSVLVALEKPKAATSRNTSIPVMSDYSIPQSPSHHRRRHSEPNSDFDNNQYRIHFLTALASIQVPSKLLRGAEVVTVAASGQTKSVIFRLSLDRFTIYLSSVGNADKANNSARSTGFFSRRSASVGTTGNSTVTSNSSIQSSYSYGGGSTRNVASPTNNIPRPDHPSLRYHRAIDIGEMDRIQRGQSTQHFELAKKNVDKIELVLRRTDLLRQTSSNTSSRSLGLGNVTIVTGSTATTATAATSNPNGSNSSISSGKSSQSVVTIQQLDPNLSFSIIFRGARTLDLMASSETERDEICDTLDRILKAYQRGKVRVSTDILLLRYIWLDIDKDKKGYVSSNQFTQILTAINFNVMKPRDLITAYEKFGKVIGLDRAQRKKGLTLEQSATFMHKVRNRLILTCISERNAYEILFFLNDSGSFLFYLSDPFNSSYRIPLLAYGVSHLFLLFMLILNSYFYRKYYEDKT